MARGIEFTVMLSRLQIMHSDAVNEARAILVDEDRNSAYPALHRAADAIGDAVLAVSEAIRELQKVN